MTTITISKELRDKLNNNAIHIGVHALAELRSAGVPVVGDIWPMGASSGELVSTYDETFEDLTFEWRAA